MPTFKYRSVEEMPRTVRVADAELAGRIRALWNRSFLFSPPEMPRGVQRFRTIEEANAARDQTTRERMRSRRDQFAASTKR